MNNIPEWPITPTFLSLKKGCKEENANYNTDGIFYTDYIRGFLADLSHDKRVQNALSIFQFVPEDFLPNDPNAENPNIITTDPEKGTVLLNYPVDKKIEPILNRQHKIIIRIDSGTFINNGRRCDCFRKCKKKNQDFCFEQDSIVGIFADEQLKGFPHDSVKYRNELDNIIKSLGNDKVVKIEELIHKGKKRFYVHYTCKKSLFEEHIFPIYLQGHVIACLMLGQMARDAFTNNENDAFSEDSEAMKNENPEIFNCNINKVDNVKWNTIAEAIFDRIQTFEKRLEDRIEHRNTRYINEEFEKIEKEFRENIKKINIKKQHVLADFSKYLNEAFDKIRDKFDRSSDGFIRMFALPFNTEHDELIPIGWSGAKFDTGKDCIFDLKTLKGIDRIHNKMEQIESIKEAASQKIKNAFQQDKDIFLPGWLVGNEIAYIVWKRHNKYIRENEENNNVKFYKKILKNFYSIALECYSYIRGARMELLLETTIQESAHESAHFILPALNVVENHLTAIQKENVKTDFEYDKYIDTYNRFKDEVSESLNQLWGINSGGSLIFTDDLKINKKPVEVYYLLYKLKKVLSNRALDSHKMIYYEQNINHVTANIDVTYFNHALYNLLDNAIKYGHEGSCIYIKMNADIVNNILIVRVISYGIGIPKEEDDRVYNLFERGTEASQITRGTGIGMYIVKKICDAHGGTVRHDSTKLSKYNIPVLFNFVKNDKLQKDFSLEERIDLKYEIVKLPVSIKSEVVYDDFFIKYQYVFKTRLNIPTYRNTFSITIPLQ